MLKFDSLYTDYQELLLDLKINAKFLTLVAPDMETLKEDVRVKYLVEQSGAEKENYRYNYSRKVSDAYEISYDTEMELQDGEELLDLWGSSSRQEFVEPSFVLKQEYIDLFSYENNPNDTERERIINSIIGDDLEEFKGGIKETEKIYGSVKEQAETVLSDDQIDNLGKQEEQVQDTSVFDDDEGIDLAEEQTVESEIKEEIEESFDSEEVDESYEEEIDEISEEEEIELDDTSSDEDDSYDEEEIEEEYSDEEEIELDESSDEEEVESEIEESNSDDNDISEDDEYEEDYEEEEEVEEEIEEDEEVELDEEEVDDLEEDSEDTDSEEEEVVVYEEVDNNVVKGVDNKVNQDFYDPTDDVSDVEMEFETTEVKVEVKEEPIKQKEEKPVQPAQSVKQEPVKSESVEQEPTNIRQFLRKHPNSDYDFVLQYFSKKEIEDSIRCGKIIKVRNKLKA